MPYIELSYQTYRFPKIDFSSIEENPGIYVSTKKNFFSLSQTTKITPLLLRTWILCVRLNLNHVNDKLYNIKVELNTPTTDGNLTQ